MTQEEFKSKFKLGVSLIHKFDNSLWYSVNCDCGDNECGSIVEIELDKELGLIYMHFYKDLYFDFWRYPDDIYTNFIKDLFYNKIINGTKRFFYRWKKALILGFTGEIKVHGDFVITEPEHITNFAEALLEGRDCCLEAKTKLEGK